MSNESKRDLAAASKTWASLEANSEEAASEAGVYRMGQLIRESAETDLPTADPALREQLVSVLEQMPDPIERAVKDNPGKQSLASSTFSMGSWIKFSTAAAISLVIGGFLWMAFMVENSHRNWKTASESRSEAVSLALIRLAEAKKDESRERMLATERTARTMQLAQLESQLRTATANYESKEEQLRVLSGLSTGSAALLEQVEARGVKGVGFGPASIDSPGKGIANRSSVDSYFRTINTVDGKTDNELRTTLKLMYGGKIEPLSEKRFFDDVSGGARITVTPNPNGNWALGSAAIPIPATDGGLDVWHYSRLEDGLYVQLGHAISKADHFGEQYDPIVENRFIPTVDDQARSTFSIDVDTASYSNMRRFINSGQRPPSNSIRIEELINYFRYDYPQPEDDKPFRVALEVAECPWYSDHRLVRIGIKGKDIHRDERPASNLVFLLDVSGSMSDLNKLPLLKRALQMMLDRLNENDRVSIVTYSGNAGVRLVPTSGDQKAKIRRVIDALSAGGSTNGSAGIEMAYDLAMKNFIKEGTNRVILATDGDLNVGITDDQSLVKLIKGKASEGVFLTVLGFGTGNLKDAKMEKLADNGNGVYAYIDSIREARKVLVDQMSGSLVTIAKDVKLQVEFNPAQVRAYRLLGYENRKMANADFANDRKDAGEIGAGHTVTAFYEIVPAGVVEPQTLSTKLKYQPSKQVEPVDAEAKSEDNRQSKEIESRIVEHEFEYRRLLETLGPGHQEAKIQLAKIEELKSLLAKSAAESGELLTLAIRYKLPDANESTLSEYTLVDSKKRFYEASGDFRFAAAVASFGMLLRNSRYRGDIDLAKVERIASESVGEDTAGFRAEFIDMVRQFTGSNNE